VDGRRRQEAESWNPATTSAWANPVAVVSPSFPAAAVDGAAGA
jgi:hypothetical protein